MTEIFNLPGALTDTQLAGDPKTLAAGGLRWLSFQAQNDTNLRDFDFKPYRDVGLSCGVWGVSYNVASFKRDGMNLAKQALKLGAEHVMADLEEGAKAQNVQLLIDGLRVGGWTGQVHLTTLGAPFDPLRDDYRIDPKPFLNTGGGIFPQAYAAATKTYEPIRCSTYWMRVGVPEDRINYMVDLATERNLETGQPTKLDGGAYAELLRAANAGPRFSIFMSQWATPADLAALKALIPPPTPTVEGTKATMRSAALAMEKEWEVRLGRPTADVLETRIALARLALDMSEDERVAVRKVLLGR